ncbi:MAG: hypothetical protein LBD84_06985 [Campylobacteraceae bacterium]|jgi:hypothetical protein|nr:hypothetical protein [Campylobacteraceae bacterium]
MKDCTRNADLDKSEQMFIQRFCSAVKRRHINKPARSTAISFTGRRAVYLNAKNASPKQPVGRQIKDMLNEICWEKSAKEKEDGKNK